MKIEPFFIKLMALELVKPHYLLFFCREKSVLESDRILSSLVCGGQLNL